MQGISVSEESVNGYAEPPASRRNGEVLADLVLFVSVRNAEPEEKVLGKTDFTLSVKDSGGRLCYVGSPFDVNEKDSVALPGDLNTDLRLYFLIPERLCLRLSEARRGTLRIFAHDWSVETPWLRDLAPGG